MTFVEWWRTLDVDEMVGEELAQRAFEAGRAQGRDEGLVLASNVVAGVDVPLSLKNRGVIRDAIAALRKRGVGT